MGYFPSAIFSNNKSNQEFIGWIQVNVCWDSGELILWHFCNHKPVMVLVTVGGPESGKQMFCCLQQWLSCSTAAGSEKIFISNFHSCRI